MLLLFAVLCCAVRVSVAVCTLKGWAGNKPDLPELLPFPRGTSRLSSTFRMAPPAAKCVSTTFGMPLPACQFCVASTPRRMAPRARRPGLSAPATVSLLHDAVVDGGGGSLTMRVAPTGCVLSPRPWVWLWRAGVQAYRTFVDAVGIDLELIELLELDEELGCFEAKMKLTMSWCELQDRNQRAQRAQCAHAVHAVRAVHACAHLSGCDCYIVNIVTLIH